MFAPIRNQLHFETVEKMIAGCVPLANGTFRRISSSLHVQLQNAVATHASGVTTVRGQWRRPQSENHAANTRSPRRRKRRLYAFGLAASGALALRQLLEPRKYGMLPLRYTHTPMRLSWADRYYVRKVACGHGFSIFSTAQSSPSQSGHSSQLFGTGLNTCGQLGKQPTESGRGSRQWLWEPAPMELTVRWKSGMDIDDIAAGRAHSLVAVKHEGIFTYGQNNHGQCGRPIIASENYAAASVSPTFVPLHFRKGDECVAAVCAGLDHSLVLSSEGKVLAFGLNSSGQCGTGNVETSHVPTLLKGSLADKTVVQVHTCADTNLALDSDGGVHIWGLTEYGQASILGKDANLSTLVEPVQLPVYEFFDKREHGPVIKVCSSGSSCALLTKNGSVFLWGWGILGFGPDVHTTGDKLMQMPPLLFGMDLRQTDTGASNTVTDLWAGLMHYVALTSRGELYVWGKNRYGLLGLGHTKDQYFPIRASIPGKVVAAALGTSHTFAVTRGLH